MTQIRTLNPNFEKKLNVDIFSQAIPTYHQNFRQMYATTIKICKQQMKPAHDGNRPRRSARV